MGEQTVSQQTSFSGRLAIQQRVLPSYRLPFFSLLSQACDGGMSIFAGDPLPSEGINTGKSSSKFELYQARNRHFKDPSTSFYFCWQDGLMSWLKAWDPDALIIEANPRYLSSRQAIDWMHRKGRPVVGWGIGAPEFSGKSIVNQPLNWVQKRFRGRFLNSLDGLIAYSNRGAKEYIAEGLPKKHVYVATNAVKNRPTEQPPERSTDYDGPLKVLFVGRLQARKRLEYLFRSCANLPTNLQPLLWIIGDGPARGDFQNLANEIYPQTEFFGARYGAELRSYFLRADLFVLPGTGGLAVQEAMAYGLPVIVAKGDGTQDDLVRAENGWQVPHEDLEALSYALEAALSDVMSLRKKGLASYRIVKEEVNLENMVHTFVQSLNQISDYSSIRC